VHEKSLRLPQLRIATNHSVSYTWETTGAEVHPQILLKSHKNIRDWTLTTLTGAAFLISILGIALFFLTRPKKKIFDL
jgi:hypothetical protein